MKLISFIIFTTYIFIAQTKAQEANPEKNLWGIQTGIYPFSAYNESRLTNNIVLRSEVFLGFGWSGNTDNTTWAILPYLNIEPRWYYNIQRRARKGKQTYNNNGNYWSVLTGIQPGFGITSNETNLYPSLMLIPSYGLRRNLGRHFNFEAAFGLGYAWIFKDYKSNETNHNHTESDTVTNIRLAIGYVF